MVIGDLILQTNHFTTRLFFFLQAASWLHIRIATPVGLETSTAASASAALPGRRPSPAARRARAVHPGRSVHMQTREQGRRRARLGAAASLLLATHSGKAPVRHACRASPATLRGAKDGRAVKCAHSGSLRPRLAPQSVRRAPSGRFRLSMSRAPCRDHRFTFFN